MFFLNSCYNISKKLSIIKAGLTYNVTLTGNGQPIKNSAKPGSRHTLKKWGKKKLNRCHKNQRICIPKVFTPTLLALNLHIVSINLFTWLSHF